MSFEPYILNAASSRDKEPTHSPTTLRGVIRVWIKGQIRLTLRVPHPVFPVGRLDPGAFRIHLARFPDVS